MDNVELLGIAVSFVLKEIAAGALKEAGKCAIFEPLKGLLNSDELTQLNLFSDTPENPALKESLERILTQKLNEHLEIVVSLVQFANDSTGSCTNSNHQTGRTNINLQDNNNVHIDFDKLLSHE